VTGSSPELYDQLKSRLRTNDQDGAIEQIYELLCAGRPLGEIISALDQPIAPAPKNLETVGNEIESTDQDELSARSARDPTGFGAATPPYAVNPTSPLTVNSPGRLQPAAFRPVEVESSPLDGIGSTSCSIDASENGPAEPAPQPKAVAHVLSPMLYTTVISAILLAGVSQVADHLGIICWIELEQCRIVWRDRV